MLKCAYCGRENNEEATHCAGCGTPFVTAAAEAEAEAEATAEAEDPRRAQGRKLMQQGIIWFVGGTAISLMTAVSAFSSPYGGHYVITFGAIIYGLAQFFRGRAAAHGTDGQEQAQELLELAARLEEVDRAQAVAIYTEVVKKFPGTRAAKEAQRNIQTLTARKEAGVS